MLLQTFMLENSKYNITYHLKQQQFLRKRVPHSRELLLREDVDTKLDVFTHLDITAPLNTDLLNPENGFVKAVTTLKKENQ